MTLKRMRDHIHIVVGRDRGKVKGWDVANEALSDTGDDILRDCPGRQLIGTQSHFHLNYPSLAAADQTLSALSALGLKVMVTELDVPRFPTAAGSIHALIASPFAR